MLAKNDSVRCLLRLMVDSDVPAHARLLKRSFNKWYWDHGWGQDHFACEEQELAIFWEIYRHISPGYCVVAVDESSSTMLGACFYHPRQHHVSLGIMAVDPDYF